MSTNSENADACDNACEKEFRKQNLWHSFKAALYGAIGGAAFLGLLTKITSMLVDYAAGETVAALHPANLPVTGLITGGLMTAGVLSTFMAQKEYTELRVLQDDHLAAKNAKMMNGRSQEPEHSHASHHAHYPQNQRRDGKEWTQVVRTEPIALAADHSRAVH